MSLELHVSAGGRPLECFALEPGIFLLGSSSRAHLVVSRQHAPQDICRVDVSPSGDVWLSALEDDVLTRWDGTHDDQTALEHGRFVSSRGVELLLVKKRTPREIAREEHPEVLPTAPAPGVRSPPKEPLALMIRVGNQMEVVDLGGAQVVLGRGPGCISLSHPSVSRRHARLVTKPNGIWIEDLGSEQGTFMDERQVSSAEFRAGSRVRLSRAIDAPELQLQPRAIAHAQGSPSEAVSAMLGASPQIDTVRAMVLRYGQHEGPVLIRGETGSGKEGVARALWALRGKSRPFRALNCSAVTESLFEAALFGHKKGAFTGAVADAPGYLEQAGDGLLFLDEVGELTLTNQAKLLRVLGETREYQRVGDSMVRQLKARVVFATHRNLEQMVREKSFREDLWYRFATFLITVPPLRDRAMDIPRLANLALEKQGGLSASLTFSDASLAKLVAHSWPGNVRQLINVVQRAAVNAQSTEIQPEDVVLGGGADEAEADPAPLELLPVHEDALIRARCEQALERASGNVAAAARALGDSGSKFRRRLVKYDLLPASRGGTGLGG